MIALPRWFGFEINDFPWFPPYFRTRVQSVLALTWRLRIPFLQAQSPASLAAQAIGRSLPSPLSDYVFVDFCSGAGGPVPLIEELVNDSVSSSSSGVEETVRFVLTDLRPHLQAWKAAKAKSRNSGIDYVSESIDAAHVNAQLLRKVAEGKKIICVFFLAYHHFEDPLAQEIMRSIAATSDGFLIFELVERTFLSLLTSLLLWPLLLVVTPIYFWQDPGHLFFTYVVPVIPFVLVFDGLVSSLRCRNSQEIQDTMCSEMSTWTFKAEEEVHTWPTGNMNYFIGLKSRS